MIRVSNLIPYVPSQVDQLRHMYVNDLLRTDFGNMVNMKWAKNQRSAYILPILKKSDPESCPVKALDNYLATLSNFTVNNPLFTVAINSKHFSFTPLTVRLAYNWLRAICTASPLDVLRVTFYSIGKSACSQHGAQVNDFKYFGGWKVSTLYRYLDKSPTNLRVAKCLTYLG